MSSGRLLAVTLAGCNNRLSASVNLAEYSAAAALPVEDFAARPGHPRLPYKAWANRFAPKPGQGLLQPC